MPVSRTLLYHQTELEYFNHHTCHSNVLQLLDNIKIQRLCKELRHKRNIEISEPLDPFLLFSSAI